MGDRAQICVVHAAATKTKGKVKAQPARELFLYAHSLGDGILGVVQAALMRGDGRHDDTDYFTRILFCELVKGDVMGTTGFGIGFYQMEDVEHHLIVVDIPEQKIYIRDRSNGAVRESWTMEEYAKMPYAELEKIDI